MSTNNKFIIPVVLAVLVLGGSGFYFFQGNNGSPVATATPTPSPDSAGSPQATPSGSPAPSLSATPTSAPSPSASSQPSQSFGGQAGPTPTASATSTPIRTSTPTPTPVPGPTTHTVSYTNSGYTPGVITVKAGDTVKFVNNSSSNMWPASNNHPTHTIYPEFDAKTAIPLGGQWSFTFSKLGTWGYHDHLMPGRTGTVIVQ